MGDFAAEQPNLAP